MREEKRKALKILNGKLYVSVLTAVLFVFMLTGGPAPVVAEDILNCAECHETYTDHPADGAHAKVDCETCHGRTDPNLTIEETHEKIFKPEMEAVNGSALCLKCHKK